ncbi:MAG TPA: hypothetical protein VF384_14020 [Planctomycetota bacterium]
MALHDARAVGADGHAHVRWTFATVAWGTIDVAEKPGLQTFTLTPDDAAKDELTRVRERLAK